MSSSVHHYYFWLYTTIAYHQHRPIMSTPSTLSFSHQQCQTFSHQAWYVHIMWVCILYVLCVVLCVVLCIVLCIVCICVMCSKQGNALKAAIHYDCAMCIHLIIYNTQTNKQTHHTDVITKLHHLSLLSPGALELVQHAAETNIRTWCGRCSQGYARGAIIRCAQGVCDGAGAFNIHVYSFTTQKKLMTLWVATCTSHVYPHPCPHPYPHPYAHAHSDIARGAV